MRDLRTLAAELIASVRGYVEGATAPLIAKLSALEARIEGIPKGDKGDPGEKGEPGDRGEKGEPGERGKDGAPGRDGKDADPIDVDALALAAAELIPIPLDGKNGEQGPPGRDGVDGKDGAPGAAGRDGIDGKDGAPGRDGKDGRDGMDGKDGAPGIDGKDGAPGRDGVPVITHPEIDFERSYPPGTYASHAGGLWGSTQQTHGMTGWTCIVRGIASVVSETEGRTERTILTLSDGTKHVAERRNSRLEDRGVWKEDRVYEVGDCVTYAGSLFIAQVDGATDRPGTSEQWRLAVKRGRDGGRS